MKRPILLDLFCGAGGCGMGYSRAGFHVVGVDIKNQPRYPFEFHRADALEYLMGHGHEFDAIHASPPCQAYTVLKTMHNRKDGHPDLLGVTRDLLERVGKPYVIENVPGAPIRASLMLCGSMFKLGTPCGAELRRHRYFETNWFSDFVPDCEHGWAGRTIGVYGGHTRNRQDRGSERTISVVGDHPRDPGAERRKYRSVSVTGHTPTSIPSGRNRVIGIYGDVPQDPTLWRAEQRGMRVVTVTGSTPQRNAVRNAEFETFPVEYARVAMGIDWMTMRELSQAIPPAYTEFIGKHLMEEVLRIRNA